MNYDRESILSGNQIQKDRQETPSTFHAANQLDRPRTKTRMAGEMGARAQELINDPNEQKNTDNWMELFGQSNEGNAFNQAKIALAAPPLAPAEEQAPAPPPVA
tara:strand:+ start:2665 stop:2976 length:312 start_codon:yes stop_codon:yes gene_type:complete